MTFFAFYGIFLIEKGVEFLNGIVRALAFAKLNLSLSVLSKRADGFHELHSVMQSISLCDRVTLTLTTEGTIIPGTGTAGEKDITVSAAKAFFQASGVKNPGLLIDIEKNIPIAAGLGGGSADGAAVLCCLNELFRTGLSPSELCAAGFSVGADVPFCIVGSTALVTGAGETVKPLSPIPDCDLLIFSKETKPGTAQMFAEYDRRFPSEKPTPNILETFDFRGLRSGIHNDFLPLYGDCFDAAFTVIKSRFPVCFGLSGSGPSAFAMFESPDKICENKLISLGYRVIRAKPERRGVSIFG